MKQSNHPNSKKITVFRAGSFANDAQINAQEFLSMSKKSIGSYWIGGGGKGVGSGLTFDEMDLLMPYMLNIPTTDNFFRQRCTEFFKTIVTRIPHGSGKELEIGLTLDNSKPVTWKNEDGKYNIPINIDDFIRYKHASEHPKVAGSQGAAKGDVTKEYYIFDKEEAISANSNAAKVKDQAMVAYLQVKENPDKVNMMLTLLNVDPRKFTGRGAKQLREQELRKIADNKADQFMKVYDSDNFEIRFNIQAMVNTGILKQVGNQYVDAETSTIFAHNLDEAVFNFQDPTYSQTVGMLKARLQEALKDLMPVIPVKTTKKAEEVTTQTAPPVE
jgi:hypothetical protein